MLVEFAMLEFRAVIASQKQNIQLSGLMSSKNKILIVLDVYEDFRQGPDDFPIEIEKAFRFITEKSDTEIIRHRFPNPQETLV